MVPEAPKHQKRKSVHAQARQQKKQKLSWSRAAAGSNAAQPATVDATKQPTTTAHKGAPPAAAPPKHTPAAKDVSKEMEELKSKIAAEQRRIREQQAKQKAEAEAKRKREQEQHAERQKKLASGFAQLRQAGEGSTSTTGRAALDVADVGVVARVLEAHSDYDTLQLRIGCDAAAVRRRYRELAFALHPDKCKVDGADEAFRKVVKAQQNLLKFLH